MASTNQPGPDPAVPADRSDEAAQGSCEGEETSEQVLHAQDTSKAEGEEVTETAEVTEVADIGQFEGG